LKETQLTFDDLTFYLSSPQSTKQTLISHTDQCFGSIKQLTKSSGRP